MADAGLLKPDDEAAKLRQAQPFRHLAAQHTAFATAPALTGDDQHEGQAVVMGAVQEAGQGAMG